MYTAKVLYMLLFVMQSLVSLQATQHLLYNNACVLQLNHAVLYILYIYIYILSKCE